MGMIDCAAVYCGNRKNLRMCVDEGRLEGVFIAGCAANRLWA